jgi:hypothetical protein
MVERGANQIGIPINRQERRCLNGGAVFFSFERDAE